MTNGCIINFLKRTISYLTFTYKFGTKYHLISSKVLFITRSNCFSCIGSYQNWEVITTNLTEHSTRLRNPISLPGSWGYLGLKIEENSKYAINTANRFPQSSQYEIYHNLCISLFQIIYKKYLDK